MRILLLGSGGREHAFAWKLSQSLLCEALFIAPGNPGTAIHGINVSIGLHDFDKLRDFVLEQEIDMVVCGPEEPLVNGLQDYFANTASLRAVLFVGPSQEGAKLEGSKAYAKAFMEEQGVPTAAYREFGIDQMEEGLRYLDTCELPVVLKADGLAAGKGVLILDSIREAKAEFRAMLDGKFGQASETVVIEEFLSGIEFSVFVWTDGKDYKILPVAKDYKRIGEGDTGLNTGGMGSISHPPFVDEVMMKKVETRIVQPTIEGLQERGIDYRGIIFIGLISVDEEPFVIEYNCRMGDPETQSVLPRLKSDLVALCRATANGTLAEMDIEIDNRAAATVIVVAGGYPEAYEKGHPISGLEEVTGSLLFHAGTKATDAGVVTNGGRVLAVTSLSDNFRDALELSLENAAKIRFKDAYFRRDIGLIVVTT
ncbi:MAG: phosphoribosylamine--glycine ligase [Saprospiraceae bacterium]